MGIAEQARLPVADHFVGHAFVAIAAFANGKISPATLVTLAAYDREGDHDALPDPQSALSFGSDLHDLAHEFVAHHVATFHSGHVAIVQVKVRAADRTARHLND